MSGEKYQVNIGGNALQVVDRLSTLFRVRRHQAITRLIWVGDMYLSKRREGYQLALVKDGHVIELGIDVGKT